MRNSHGGTLPFVIVTIMFLFATGLGLFYMMKLLGGHRELSNAADAGTIAVAKVGVELPTVKFAESEIAKSSAFGGLVDSNTGGFNLQSYNRAVGQAFLVALNAEADGNTTGIINAKSVIRYLQGPNGVGAKLKDKLSNPGSKTDSWVQTSFLPSAVPNSLRMLADGQATPLLDYKVSAQTYGVSYIKPVQEELNTSNTNIELNKHFNKQVPFKDYRSNQQVALPANATATDQRNSYRSLRGYDPLKIGRVGEICAVTMSPFDQPHLVSNQYFTRNTTSPAENKSLVVPPNSFQTVVAVADQRSALNVGVRSTSMVGTSALNIPLKGPNPYQLSPVMPKYDLAIPRGYLIIDNKGDGKDSSYTGLLPQMNTKAAPWYGTTGVSVDATGIGCFSNNGRVEQWMAYNAKPIGLKHPTLDGLYNQSGQPASPAEAKLIAPQLDPKPCHCHDLNSDSASPNVNPVCARYATSRPYNPGPFDKAYYPNYLNPPIYAKSGQQLTAGELAKMKTWNLYLSNGIGGMLADVNRSTGTRVYPHAPLFPSNDPLFNMPTPFNAIPGTNYTMGVNTSPQALAYSSPVEPGQVTREGSVLDLMQQVATHDPNLTHFMGRQELKRFLENRLWQIKPDATQAEIDLVLARPIALGQKLYLYLDSKRNFTLDPTAPFWMDTVSGEVPDGSPHNFGTIPFSLLGTLVNTGADFNIHELPFLESSGPTIFDRISASFTPSSGANNLLGVVKFTEHSAGIPVFFSNAN